MADNKFFQLFNDIDEKYIQEAEQTASGPDMYIEYIPKKPSKRTVIISAAVTFAACAALVIGIVKLPGLISGLPVVGPDSQNSSSWSVGDVAFEHLGSPIPDEELEDFNIDELAESYSQTFPEELNAVLDEIGKPEVTAAYTRARTLADLQWHISNADVIATDTAKEKMTKKMRSTFSVTVPTADTAYPDPVYELYETGYRYDSFIEAFRNAFCGDAAENLIRLSRFGFVNYGEQLYATDVYSMGADSYGLVHTDYELLTNTDSEVVFNTVCYFDYAKQMINGSAEVEPEPYDPANKHTYINRVNGRFVLTYTNRLIKADGVWKAFDIDAKCSNRVLPKTFEDYRANITDELVFEIDLLPGSVHADFEYDAAFTKYVDVLKNDEGLTELLEKIGDSEFTEQYYKARILAEVVALNDETGISSSDFGGILSFRDDYNQECDRYLEMRFTYDSFLKTLNEIFGKDTVNYLLERGTFYNYNNALCQSACSFSENPLLVHTEYEFVSQSEDEIVFDTICYRIRPEDYNAYLGYGKKQPYDPSDKGAYDIVSISNRFVKVNGKWKAEKLCFLGDLSSVGEVNEGYWVDTDSTIPRIITGNPLPESELVDFSYEETLENYRRELAEDKGLTAVLEQINKSEFTDCYYRARTLADMLANVEGAELIPSEKVRTGHEPATVEILTQISSQQFIFGETGYKYDSFLNTMRDTFGDNADKLFDRYGNFYEYNGGLYYRVRYYPSGDLYLVHTDYELKTNKLREIVFDTICYMVDSDYYDPTAPELIKPEFDPNKKDYIIKKITNRFVMENGKWHAEEICMEYGKSSAWETNMGDTLTDDRGNSFVLSGTPLSESELVDFTYEDTLKERRAVYDENGQLAELLDGLGKPEVKELYCRARTLAEIAAMEPNTERALFSNNVNRNARITMYDDTPALIYSTIDPSYKAGQTFIESGFKYESFIGALNDVFTEESAAWLLALNPHFYGYDGQLYCTEGTAGYPINLVHTEYELVENSGDTVKFTTVNYYMPFEAAAAGMNIHYEPELKDEYEKTRVNNEFRYIDGEWKAYEICILGDCSSLHGRSEPTRETVYIGDHKYTVSGTPTAYTELADFNYTEQYMALYESDIPEKVTELLGIKTAETYLRALALTNGAYGGGFISNSPNSTLTDEDGIVYYSTGCSESSFKSALNNVFTENAIKDIFDDSGMFVTYNDELYQRDFVITELAARKIVVTEYELVNDTDSETGFNTHIRYGYSDEADSDGVLTGNFEGDEMIKNRLVFYDNGYSDNVWRVDEMCILNYISSNNLPI